MDRQGVEPEGKCTLLHHDDGAGGGAEGGQQSVESGRIKGTGQCLEQAEFVDDQRAGGVAVKGGEGGTPEGGRVEGPRGARQERRRKGGRNGRLHVESASRGTARENGVEKSIQGRGDGGVPGGRWTWGGGWWKIA